MLHNMRPGEKHTIGTDRALVELDLKSRSIIVDFRRRQPKQRQSREQAPCSAARPQAP
jgi:hypothetical protein